MCANDRSRDLHYTQVLCHFSKCRCTTAVNAYTDRFKRSAAEEDSSKEESDEEDEDDGAGAST